MKIGLMGAQCTGKTSLLNHLKKKHPNWVIVEEVAHGCPHPINENTGFMSQQWILREQIHRELAAGCLYPSRTVISDRTTLDHIAYIMHGRMSKAEAEHLIRTAKAWGSTYDLIFYIPIEVPMVGDGIRSVDRDFQYAIDQHLQSLIGFIASPITIRGSIEERALSVEEAIEGWKARPRESI